MRYLLVLLCLVMAVYAVPKQHFVTKGLPTVGTVFGPAMTAMSYVWKAKINPHTTLEDLVTTNKFSDTVEGMITRMQDSVTDKTVVIKIDPNKVNGKYLEVLQSKAIAPDAIKMVCHYPGELPAVCHKVESSGRYIVKLTYSMVRLLDDSTVFPVVFISHKVCPDKCYWITHPAEIAVVDKSII